MRFRDKFKSRKLWVTIATMAVGVFYPPALPLLKLIAPAYLVSQGTVDAVEAWNRSRGKSE